MVFRFQLLLIINAFYSALSFAELSDPTKPAFYLPNKDTVYNQTDHLKLSSIWISSHSKRATINGVTGKQGETILSDIKIIRILKDSVVIEQNNIRRKLNLLNGKYKTRQSLSNL